MNEDRGLWEDLTPDYADEPVPAEPRVPLGSFEVPGGFRIDVSGLPGQSLNLSAQDLAQLAQWLQGRSTPQEPGWDDFDVSDWYPTDADAPEEEPDAEPPEDDEATWDWCDMILSDPSNVRGPFMTKAELGEYRRRLPRGYTEVMKCEGLWYIYFLPR